jgi:hypothetical protein
MAPSTKDASEPKDHAESSRNEAVLRKLKRKLEGLEREEANLEDLACDTDNSMDNKEGVLKVGNAIPPAPTLNSSLITVLCRAGRARQLPGKRFHPSELRGSHLTTSLTFEGSFDLPLSVPSPPRPQGSGY